MADTTSTQKSRPWPAVAAAVALTTAALSVGYWALGLSTMLIFTAGFVGGLLLWLAWPSGGGWADIRALYWVALSLFLAPPRRRKTDGVLAFLAAVTGVPIPAINSVPVVLLVTVSACACLLVPALLRRGPPNRPISDMDVFRLVRPSRWHTSRCSRGLILQGPATCPECGPSLLSLRSPGGDAASHSTAIHRKGAPVPDLAPESRLPVHVHQCAATRGDRSA